MQAPVTANENKAPGAEGSTPTPVRPGIAPKPNSRFRLWTAEEIEKLPPATWLIKDILPENGLAVLYGAPGAYKTFLALDWALCANSGLPWHGHGVMKGNVVYVYAEGTKGIAQRIKAWRQTRGGDVSQFRVLPTALDMCNVRDVRELIAAIQEKAPDPVLVVIDTLARCFGDGDENAQKAMNAFVKGCDMIREEFSKCTVLVVHHTGKDPSGKDRGSTVLRGAVDTMLSTKANGKGSNRIVTLSCDKQKDAEAFEPITLAPIRVSLPDSPSSCVLEMATGSVGTASGDLRVIENDKQALDALATFGPAGAHYSHWCQKCEKSGLPESTFKAVRRRLVNSGRVVLEGEYYRIALSARSGLEQGRNQAA